jgi:hypothetical protein
MLEFTLNVSQTVVSQLRVFERCVGDCRLGKWGLWWRYRCRRGLGTSGSGVMG